MNTPQITFTTGGTVQAGGGFYLARQADEDLLQLCRAGRFAYILTARQMGKSSLMVRTVERLGAENIRAVMIDLTQIGTQVTPEQWYLGLLAMIEEQLGLSTDAVQWWQAHAHLGLTQRLTRFLQEVVLHEITEPIVIFVDEIDTTLSLDFTDDFFAAIRSYYNARATAPEFVRLSFVLIGVATPGDLIRDPQRTPFNIGQRVDLTDFTRAEAQPLADGLQLPATEAAHVLDRVLHWTNGHPYLTQRLCQTLSEARRPHWTHDDVDRSVEQTFFGAMSEQNNNLQFVRDMLTKRAQDVEGVLMTYRDVRSGKRSVADEEQSLNKSHLKLSGIVRRQSGGALQVSNLVYETVFDEAWVRGHLPVNWRRRFKYAAAAMLAALVILMPATAVNAYRNNQLEDINRQLREVNRKLEATNADLTARSEELNRALQTAKENEDKAKTNATKAEQQQQLAQASARETDRQRNLGLVREEAYAALQPWVDPDVGLRLINESLGIARTAQGENILRNYLRNRPMVRTLRDPDRTIRSAAYSPNGRFIVTANQDVAYVWNADSARQVVKLTGHEKNVNSAVYSPNGRFIVTASLDGTARIWDAVTGQPLKVLPHESVVNSARYSPDGRFIVTASGYFEGDEQLAQVWDAITGKLIVKLEGHREKVTSAAYSPDGHFIVTASHDHTARVWDAATGKEVGKELTHDSYLNSASYSPDGRFIVTAGWDDITRIWDAMTRKVLFELKGREVNGSISNESCAAYSPDGCFVVTLSKEFLSVNSDTVRIWYASTGQLVKEFNGGQGGEEAVVSYSPDGRSILTASRDTMQVWDAHVENIKEILPIHAGEINNLTFSPDGRFVAMASGGLFNKNERLQVWNAVTGQKEFGLEGGPGALLEFSSVAYSPDGRFIVAGGDYESAGVWDTATKRFLFELKDDKPNPQDKYLSVDFVSYSPDGRFIVTANDGSSIDDKVARVWNAGTGKLKFELKGHTDYVHSANYSPDGRFIITASSDSTARIWDAVNGKFLAELKGHGKGVRSAAYSPNGRFIVTASHDGTARIWDTATRQTVRELKGHKWSVLSATWSPDGRSIVTASGDQTARVWDAATGRQVAELKGHAGSVSSALFSPNGRFIVTAGSDGTVRFWPPVMFEPFENVLTRLRQLSPQTLTNEERALYLSDDMPANRQRQLTRGRR